MCYYNISFFKEFLRKLIAYTGLYVCEIIKLKCDWLFIWLPIRIILPSDLVFSCIFRQCNVIFIVWKNCCSELEKCIVNCIYHVPFNLKGDLKNQFAVVSMLLCWFNFILGFNFTFFCFKLINMHYHTPKQKKLKSQPRTKLIEPQHNLYDEENINFSIQRYKFW